MHAWFNASSQNGDLMNIRRQSNINCVGIRRIIVGGSAIKSEQQQSLREDKKKEKRKENDRRTKGKKKEKKIKIGELDECGNGRGLFNHKITSDEANPRPRPRLFTFPKETS